MQKLIFAKYDTELRPRAAVKVAAYDHGEPDSYELEEEQLLFAAWSAEVDAGDPPF